MKYNSNTIIIVMLILLQFYLCTCVHELLIPPSPWCLLHNTWWYFTCIHTHPYMHARTHAHFNTISRQPSMLTLYQPRDSHNFYFYHWSSIMSDHIHKLVWHLWLLWQSTKLNPLGSAPFMPNVQWQTIIIVMFQKLFCTLFNDQEDHGLWCSYLQCKMLCILYTFLAQLIG